MHDDTATIPRPTLRRNADSRAGNLVPVPRAERLLTVREVARLLFVSPPTVYSIIRRGGLRALYEGRKLRLRARQVDTYMQVHEEWLLRQQAKHRRSKPA